MSLWCKQRHGWAWYSRCKHFINGLNSSFCLWQNECQTFHARLNAAWARIYNWGRSDSIVHVTSGLWDLVWQTDFAARFDSVCLGYNQRREQTVTLLNAIYPLSTDAVPRYVCIHPLCTSIQSQTDYTPIHRDHVEMEYETRPVHHWHFKNCCRSEYCQWIDPTAQHMNTQLGGTIKSGTKSAYDCQSQVFSPGDRCLLSWCLRGGPLPMKLIHEQIWSAPFALNLGNSHF